MPIVNNQIEYPLSGEYSGTLITAPAKLPDPTAPVQEEPNIVRPLLNSTGTMDAPNISSPKTNLGFGIISVTGQQPVEAKRYMSEVTFIPGTNMSITTNPTLSTITFSAIGVTSVGVTPGTGIGVSGSPVTSSGNITVTNTGVTELIAGTSIAVSSGNGNVTVTNTMTEIVYSGGAVTTSLTPDRNNGSIQKFTLTDNFTLNTPLNMAVGQSLTLILTQDGVGGHDVTANSAYLFAGSFNTLSNGPGEIDMMNMFYDGTTYYVTLTVGYSNA